MKDRLEIKREEGVASRFLVNKTLIIKAILYYWHRNSGFGGSSDVSNIGCQISCIFVVLIGRSLRKPVT